MQSLLSGIKNDDIRLTPFPHVIVPNALPEADYAALCDSFPPFSRIGWATNNPILPNNRRFALPAANILSAEDMPACWKHFVELHSSPDFLAAVAALFQDHWPRDMLAALGGSLTGHSTGRLNLSGDDHDRARIRQDARIEINTPVRDRASCVRGPHLDTPNRLFSGLFYMRAAEDDSVGGELLLYRWREQPIMAFDAYELPPHSVEEVARIPYRANQLVLFPQGMNAIHGVAPREPTPHCRRYVFITAELGQDWLRRPGDIT
ncbi:2OG-Fe(II) oxygenase [Asticcacaulis sp.]|uniref:2OG-Fe(II) oxygenase n=1 Tax=Asticcacaulis sp. TaxID=1872648 RepID=UPI002609FC60|nr:2OG-Fe(II) oxygenase [Asticcacaulis sp.]